MCIRDSQRIDEFIALLVVEFLVSEAHHLIGYILLFNHKADEHILVRQFLCVRDVYKRQEEGFSRNPGHSYESGTADIQGIPYGNAHQLAMVPDNQGIASAGA